MSSLDTDYVNELLAKLAEAREHLKKGKELLDTMHDTNENLRKRIEMETKRSDELQSRLSETQSRLDSSRAEWLGQVQIAREMAEKADGLQSKLDCAVKALEAIRDKPTKFPESAYDSANNWSEWSKKYADGVLAGLRGVPGPAPLLFSHDIENAHWQTCSNCQCGIRWSMTNGPLSTKCPDCGAPPMRDEK